MRTIGRRNTRMLAVAAALASAAAVQADSFTWTNTAGGTWSTGSNWSSSPTVPASGDSTTLNFSTLNASYTTTNDLGTQASPFQVNRIIFGTAGTPTINGGFLEFTGANPTIEKLGGGGTPAIGSTIVLNAGVTLTYLGTLSEQLNLSSTGKVTGAGGLAIERGTLVMLSANNDYSGGTTLNGGEVVIFADSSVSGGTLMRGPVGTGTLTLNGGTIRTNSGNARTLYNAISIGGNVIFGSSSGNNLTLAGLTSIAGSGVSRTITIANAKTLTFSNTIGDGGAGNGLTINGTGASGFGTVSFGGGLTDTAANSYTGTTTLNSDRALLALNKADGTNAIAANLNVVAGSLVWNRANQIADSASVTLSAATTSTVLNFTANERIANLVVTGGTLRGVGGVNVTVSNLLSISGGGSASSPHHFGGTLTVGGMSLSRPDAGTGIYDVLSMNTGTTGSPANTAGTLILAGDVAVTGANGPVRVRQGGPGGTLDLNGAQRTFNVSDGTAVEDFLLTVALADSVGGGSFRKTGAGTLALVADVGAGITGDNVIEQGRIVVYNHNDNPLAGGQATGTGRVTINSGATLGGNGKVAAVTINGTLDPSIPSASNLGGVYSTVPTLVVASAIVGDGGTVHLDGIGAAAADKLVVNGELDLSSGSDTLALVGAYDASSDTVLVSYSSISGVFDTVTFNGGALPGYYSVNYTSTSGPGQVVLSVPEPGMGTILGMALLPLLRRRRAR